MDEVEALCAAGKVPLRYAYIVHWLILHLGSWVRLVRVGYPSEATLSVTVELAEAVWQFPRVAFRSPPPPPNPGPEHPERFRLDRWIALDQVQLARDPDLILCTHAHEMQRELMAAAQSWARMDAARRERQGSVRG